MGSMTDEEYVRKFLELLRYVPYLKEQKANIHRFISGLLVAFKDKIEFDDPRLLEEDIRKMKHCYEKFKCTFKTKQVQKSNDKNKGKWDTKQTRPHDMGNKENASPLKKFNASNGGKVFQFQE